MALVAEWPDERITRLEYDPYAFDIDVDPYPSWQGLRDEHPLYFNEQYGFWALSRFEDVHRASADHETFSSARGTVLELLDLPAELVPQYIIFMDPPGHTQLRKVVSRAFTPRSIAALEPRIRELCKGYLSKAEPGERFDLVQDFGALLPMMVIGTLLGIPEEDLDQVRHWSDALVARDEGVTGFNFEALGALTDYLGRLAEERRSHPQDDMISLLLGAGVGPTERSLTDVELVDFVTLLAGAGNETVARLLGWAGWVLAANPGERVRLREDRSLLPSAVEELLRYEAPSPVQARITTRSVELHGQVVPEGSKMLLLTGAAGRDEREYPDPNRFDVGRSATRHLSLGHGIHFCLGAALARLEGVVALDELLHHLPTWEVDEPGAQRVRTSTVRGFQRLPVLV